MKIPAALAVTAAFAIFSRSAPTMPAPDPLDVAAKYLVAYGAMDFERLAGFYTEDSTWQDPTGAEIGASTEVFRGPDAIRAHLAQATYGLENLTFDLPERFTSGGQVVCFGTMSYDTALAAPDGTARSASFAVRTVIVLEVKGEKVLAHTDYADFRAWSEQYRAALR